MWTERGPEEAEDTVQLRAGALEREDMEKYIVYENPDSTERGITREVEYLLHKDFHSVDAYGKPMRVVLEFEAETWNEAMQKFNDHYGYGKYVPME